MSEDFIQLLPDGSGKKTRTIKETIGPNEVHSETVVLLGWDGTDFRKVLVDSSGKLRCVTQ